MGAHDASDRVFASFGKMGVKQGPGAAFAHEGEANSVIVTPACENSEFAYLRNGNCLQFCQFERALILGKADRKPLIADID